MHDRLFAGQNELDDQSLVRYAREPDLDAEAVAQELAEQTHVVRLEDQRQSGITSGVAGTPTVPFDGRRYDGSGSLPKMPAAIPRYIPRFVLRRAPAHGPRIPRIRWPREDER
jgi:protein-disulfide isomerase